MSIPCRRDFADSRGVLRDGHGFGTRVAEQQRQQPLRRAALDAKLRNLLDRIVR
jgi:hypothetical protein